MSGQLLAHGQQRGQRIQAEVQGLRFVADKLLAVQMPVLSYEEIGTEARPALIGQIPA